MSTKEKQQQTYTNKPESPCFKPENLSCIQRFLGFSVSPFKLLSSRAPRSAEARVTDGMMEWRSGGWGEGMVFLR